jgi:hypothetical protein
MSLCGTWIERMPTFEAPQMSSKSRSPTNTQAPGSCTPTASMAARNASGAGLVQRISLV